MTASTEGAKAKPKKAPKSLPRKNKKKPPQPVRGEPDLFDRLGPHFSLVYRWTPRCKAQAYLVGTVNDNPTKRFLTNVSVTMSHQFSGIMSDLLAEARQGNFKTREELVHRRDVLLYLHRPAVPPD